MIYVCYLVVIRLVGEELRTHVVRGSYESARHVVLILQNLGDAQVTYFDYVCLGQEDVLGLQVSVQYMLFMQILPQCKESGTRISQCQILQGHNVQRIQRDHVLRFNDAH